MNHEEAFETLEAYVFGELDAAREKALERHLESGCEVCESQLRDFQAQSVREARSVAEHEPPAHVKEAVFKRIRDASGGRRSRRVSVGGVLGWAAAGVAVAAVAGLLVWTSRLQSEIGGLQARLDESSDQVAQLQNDAAVQQRASDLLGKPCTRLIDLAGVDPNPNAYGKVMLHPEEHVGVIYVYRMPQPPSGMAYQLWMMMDGTPTSVGMFSVREDGSNMLTLQKLPDPKSIAAFEVTIEPAEGRPEPTGMSYLTGANVLFEEGGEH